jgi:hypothetical protein
VLDSALQQVGWLLVEHVESGLWGFYDRAEQVDELIDSLDERGKRESVLKRRLENRKQELEECMNQADELVTSQLDAFRSVVERGGTTVEHEAERQRLVEEITQAEAEVEAAETELAERVAAFESAVTETAKWAVVKTAEGKTYYYVKGTQNTQWDKPEDLVSKDKAEAAKVKSSEKLETKKANVVSTKQQLEALDKEAVDPKRTMLALAMMVDHDRLISRIVDTPDILPRIQKFAKENDDVVVQVKDVSKQHAEVGKESGVAETKPAASSNSNSNSNAMEMDAKHGNGDECVAGVEGKTDGKHVLDSSVSPVAEGAIDGLALNNAFVSMGVRRSWWRTVRRVVAMLLSTEHAAAGPRANPNLCPIHVAWINNDDMRKRWIKYVAAIAQPPYPTSTNSSSTATNPAQQPSSNVAPNSSQTAGDIATVDPSETTTGAATPPTELTNTDTSEATPTEASSSGDAAGGVAAVKNEEEEEEHTTRPVDADWAMEPDRPSILAALRDATQQLFDVFVGDPDELKRSRKAQLAVQRINLHEWRFKRALSRTQSLHDVALLVQWLQELLTVSMTKRRLQVETKVFDAMCQGQPIDAQLVDGNAGRGGGKQHLSVPSSARNTRTRSRTTRASRRGSRRDEDDESEDSEDEQAALAAAVAATSGRRSGGRMGGLDVSNIIFASRSRRSTRGRTTQMVVSDDDGESDADSQDVSSEEEEEEDDDDEEYENSGARRTRKRKASTATRGRRGRSASASVPKKAKTMQTTTTARGRQTRRPVSYADGALGAQNGHASDADTASEEDDDDDDDDDDGSASGEVDSSDDDDEEEEEDEEEEDEEDERPTRTLRARARVSYKDDDDDEDEDESD